MTSEDKKVSTSLSRSKQVPQVTKGRSHSQHQQSPSLSGYSSSAIATTQDDSNLDALLFAITGIKFKPGSENVFSATFLYQQKQYTDYVVGSLTAALNLISEKRSASSPNPVTLKEGTAKGQPIYIITVELSEIERARLKRDRDNVKDVYLKSYKDYKNKYLAPFRLILKACSPNLYLHGDQSISVVCNLTPEEVRLVANALRDAIRHFLSDSALYDIVAFGPRKLLVNNLTEQVPAVNIRILSPKEYEIIVKSAKKITIKLEERLRFYREHLKVSPAASLSDLDFKNVNAKQVKTILRADEGAVSQRDSKGNYPLSRAIIAGRKDIVRLLVSAEADIYMPDKNGTPIMVAIARDDSIVSTLFSASKLKNSESYIKAFSAVLYSLLYADEKDKIFAMLLDKLIIESAETKDKVYPGILKVLINKANLTCLKEILIRNDIGPYLLESLKFAVTTLIQAVEYATVVPGTPNDTQADRREVVKYLLEAAAISGAPGFRDALEPAHQYFNNIGLDIDRLIEQRTIAVTNLLDTLSWSGESAQGSQGFFPKDVIKILIEYLGIDLSASDSKVMSRPSKTSSSLSVLSQLQKTDTSTLTDLKGLSSLPAIPLQPQAETTQTVESSVIILKQITGLEVEYSGIGGFEFPLASEEMAENFEDVLSSWLFEHGIAVEDIYRGGTSVFLTATLRSINDMTFGSTEGFANFLKKYSNPDDNKQLQSPPMTFSSVVVYGKGKIMGSSQNFFGPVEEKKKDNQGKSKETAVNDRKKELVSMTPG